MATPPKPRPEGRVLVVDDHPEMVRLLADQLGDGGYQVELCLTGGAALSLAEKWFPDVVLTDLRMDQGWFALDTPLALLLASIVKLADLGSPVDDEAA